MYKHTSSIHMYTLSMYEHLVYIYVHVYSYMHMYRDKNLYLVVCLCKIISIWHRKMITLGYEQAPLMAYKALKKTISNFRKH